MDEVVRSSVEDTLNAMLEAEADQLCQAQRYERSPDRADTRAGHYDRKLHTKAGDVTLKVPKLRTLPFETAIIERYRRREASVEEALVEMYLAGVSVRRVEDVTEALWGTRVSSGTVSRLNQRIYEQIEAWRQRPITGASPYVYLDGVSLKRSWGGEVRNVSVLIAIGVGTDGYRHILGVAEGEKEDLEGWRGFLRHLKTRGLKGVQLNHQRCVCRAGRGGGRMLSQGPLATVRRPLVSERLLPPAARPDRHRCPDAEGDPRPGGSEGGRTESEGGCREADRAEAAEGCGARPRDVQSDADLLRVPEHPLATESAPTIRSSASSAKCGGARESLGPFPMASPH